MSGYDKHLSIKILKYLDERFPLRAGPNDISNGLGGGTAPGDILLAIDALEKSKLIDAKVLRNGVDAVPVVFAWASINEAGRKSLLPKEAVPTSASINYNNYGQAAAMGHGASGTINNAGAVWQSIESGVDLSKLHAELSTLRETLPPSTEGTVQAIDAGYVALAEKSAENGDGPQVIHYLSSVTRSVAEVAQKIGVDLVAAIIVKAMEGR